MAPPSSPRRRRHRVAPSPATKQERTLGDASYVARRRQCWPCGAQSKHDERLLVGFLRQDKLGTTSGHNHQRRPVSARQCQPPPRGGHGASRNQFEFGSSSARCFSFSSAVQAAPTTLQQHDRLLHTRADPTSPLLCLPLYCGRLRFCMTRRWDGVLGRRRACGTRPRI